MDYYKALLQRIEEAYKTRSCIITGLLEAKKLYETTEEDKPTADHEKEHKQMKTTEARIFCGRDAEGPIILIAGTKEKIYGVDMIQYFQKPSFKEPAKHTKYVCWEGRIRTDIIPGTMLEESTEECADLIERFFPYANIKYVALEEVLQ